MAAREILGARRRLLRRRPWIRRSYVAGAALVLLGSGVLAWQQWTRVEPRVVVESAAEREHAAGRRRRARAARSPPEPDESFVGPPAEAGSKDAG